MPRQIPLFGESHLQGPLKQAFERLWAAYPPRRPNPRARAEAAFRLIVKHHAPDALVAAAEAFAAEQRALCTEPAFIPHLATWLRERRFLDYPPFTSATEAEGSISADDQAQHPWWLAFAASGFSAAEFRAWIEPLTVLDLAEGKSALLLAPSRFKADYVRSHYRAPLARALGVAVVEITHEVSS